MENICCLKCEKRIDGSKYSKEIKKILEHTKPLSTPLSSILNILQTQKLVDEYERLMSHTEIMIGVDCSVSDLFGRLIEHIFCKTQEDINNLIQSITAYDGDFYIDHVLQIIISKFYLILFGKTVDFSS